MRTTLNIEDELLAKAAELTGIKEKTSLVKLGLEALIARESAKRLAALAGTEKQLTKDARRRQRPPHRYVSLLVAARAYCRRPTADSATATWPVCVISCVHLIATPVIRPVFTSGPARRLSARRVRDDDVECESCRESLRSIARRRTTIW